MLTPNFSQIFNLIVPELSFINTIGLANVDTNFSQIFNLIELYYFPSRFKTGYWKWRKW